MMMKSNYTLPSAQILFTMYLNVRTDVFKIKIVYISELVFFTIILLEFDGFLDFEMEN